MVGGCGFDDRCVLWKRPIYERKRRGLRVKKLVLGNGVFAWICSNFVLTVVLMMG